MSEKCESFAIQNLRVNFIDYNYDSFYCGYRYIHTIDTGVSYSGLLITDGVLGLTN